jgi:MPBQ/MSBQ methyltransferase
LKKLSIQDLTPHTKYDRLIAYYEGAGPDYGEWSADFNMHYGYYCAPLNPFRRDPMLNEMNRQVLDRLRLDPARHDFLVDLGCGVGATVRYAAGLFPAKRIVGITVVPWQVETGNAWNRRVGLHPRALLALDDYVATSFPSASVDGAVAIESACHADGPDKDPFVREAARILKPGARLAVADAFLKNPDRPMGPLSSRLYDVMCRSFALPGLGQIEHFADALRRHGFTDVTIEDISWRVAPSALHAPVTVLWFTLKKIAGGLALSEQSLNNLKGSLFSAFLGANRMKFGYYIVSATKG